jgi:hypothetical protein
MASIEEQLDRDEWAPVPGDQLIGIITSIEDRASKKGPRYPVLLIKDDDTGRELIVSCGMFRGEVIARQPGIGDRIGIKFAGPRPRSDGDGSYDSYSVAFEDIGDQPPVDWAAMARSNELPAPAAREPEPEDPGPLEDEHPF